MTLKQLSVAEFLLQQKTNFRSSLPVAHSSDSSSLPRILTSGRIDVSKCDTFTPDKLAYFFHGKPSYRKFNDRPKYWQLPTVFLLKSTCLVSRKRVFPFDSGAFFRSRLPSYITDFGIDGFELSSTPNAIDLLVDIFFGDDDSYLHSRARPESEVKHRKKLGINEIEINALCCMYNGDLVLGDDRTRAIEIQVDEDVKIFDGLLAVVMPRPYFENAELKGILRKNKVIARPYDVFELSVESYMANIYREVLDVYKKLDFINAR